MLSPTNKVTECLHLFGSFSFSFLYFGIVVLNKKKLLIIVNLYPTRTRGIIVLKIFHP